MFDEIHFDPGITGFVKGHRHISGPSLIMTTWKEENRDWAAVFWVKRLHHAASPIFINLFRLLNKQTMKAVERTYSILMSWGPPTQAYREKPDFQRKRVYDWEEDNIFPGFEPMPWSSCKAFLTAVWQKVGKGPEPLLTIDRRLKRPISYRGAIFFPEHDKEFHWREPIILHEIAHELKFDDKHGPLFVKCYMKLCTEFLGFERKELRNSAERYGVRY